jgi:hypothetical protein
VPRPAHAAEDAQHGGGDGGGQHHQEEREDETQLPQQAWQQCQVGASSRAQGSSDFDIFLEIQYASVFLAWPCNPKTSL